MSKRNYRVTYSVGFGRRKTVNVQMDKGDPYAREVRAAVDRAEGRKGVGMTVHGLKPTS